MPGLLKRFWEWEKYERLHHYPELNEFSREEALRRLEQYERMTLRPGERERGWRLVIFVVIAWTAFCLAIGLWALHVWYFPGFVVIGILWYTRYRRLRKRVRATIAAEKADGKFEFCVDCGYDLRGSDGELCPECGQSIRVTPPNEPSRP